MIRIDQVLSFGPPDNEVAVVGWCCREDLTPAGEVWAECGTVRVPCLTGLPRPDVAALYHSPALHGAGFLFRIQIRNNRSPVKILERRADGDHVIGVFSVGSVPATRHPQADRDYGRWLRTAEPRLFWPDAEIDKRLRALRYQPSFSIILPTFNTHLYHLHRCIASVTAQHYQNWELCVTDDASPDPRVRQYLLERAAGDPRIRLMFSEQRGGISAASNRSLTEATGDFIVLLDHDDELHRSALVEVARCLNAHQDADVVYSDEDKIDQLGARSCPAFKPGFDEDLLCGFDYLGHLISIRTALVRQVGGFRTEADGAQDWDLLLRVASATSRDKVKHVPKPLYHWRMHDDSTAFSLSAKPYVAKAWNVALGHYLQAAPSCTATEGLFFGSMRIHRKIAADTRVAVLSRACDGVHQRRALNRSRLPIGIRFFEAVFSSIHAAEAPGSSALMSHEELDADVLVVVNGGIDSVNHHFLDELAAQAVRDEVGVVGCTILSSGGTVVSAGLVSLSDGTHLNPFQGMRLHELGYMGQAKVVRSVASIAPHVFAFRTSRLRDLSGLAALAEDSLTDLCTALVHSSHSAGLRVLHTPYAIATLRTSLASYHPPQGDIVPRSLMVNPNLEAFDNLSAILKAGLV